MLKEELHSDKLYNTIHEFMTGSMLDDSQELYDSLKLTHSQLTQQSLKNW